MPDDPPSTAPTAITESPSLSTTPSSPTDPNPAPTDLLDLAIRFLQSTSGKDLGSGPEADEKRREFLRGKGLSQEMVEEAFLKAGEGEVVAKTETTKTEGSETEDVKIEEEIPVAPPRTYNNDSRALVPPPPPTIPMSNRTIIRFLRTLALLIFVTGGVSGGVAMVFQRYLFPKLLIKTTTLKTFTDTTLANYDKLLTGLRSMVTEHGAWWPRASALVLEAPSEKATKEDEEGKPKEATTEEEPPTTISPPVPEPAESPTPTDPPTPELTTPLRSSLATLSKTLRSFKHPPVSTLPASASASHLPEPTAAQSLHTVLENFTSTLANESMHTPWSSSLSGGGGYVNPYISGGGARGEGGGAGAGGVREAVAGVKGEVRALKGMLLNRRNFLAGGWGAAPPVVDVSAGGA